MAAPTNNPLTIFAPLPKKNRPPRAGSSHDREGRRSRSVQKQKLFREYFAPQLLGRRRRNSDALAALIDVAGVVRDLSERPLVQDGFRPRVVSAVFPTLQLQFAQADAVTDEARLS